MKSSVLSLLLFFLITGFTSGFIMRRSGCPEVASNNPCLQASENTCYIDENCGENMKCCSNGCNLVCVNSLSGLASMFSLFYDPFSYAAFGPFKNLFGS
ncbi:waprin-Lio1-like [Anomaloglossus baeobatrachus]|uniref:waprin-Lio1-like n=1 Tax=Anomaloglossus baeobatrachus TaxID=238106 RepID=UPI003F4FF774